MSKLDVDIQVVASVAANKEEDVDVIAMDIADGGSERPRPNLEEQEVDSISVSENERGERVKHCPSSGVGWFEVGGVGERYCGPPWLVVINMRLGVVVAAAVAVADNVVALLLPVGPRQAGVDDLDRELGAGEAAADSCLRRRMLYRFLAAREVRLGK